jgi:AcrR family transcriptional regulator
LSNGGSGPLERGRPTDHAAGRARSSREATLNRILDAAEELFAARNPRDVTVREISAKAGVTHALVHQYVGTKDDLLNAVLQRVATDRTALVKKSATLDEALRVVVRQILANRLHSRSLVRSAMDGVEYVSLRDRIGTAQALLELADDTAALGLRPAPRPDAIDSRVVIAAISSLAFGWVALEDWNWPAFGLDPADKEEVYRQLDQIVSYLGDLVLEGADGRTAE